LRRRLGNPDTVNLGGLGKCCVLHLSGTYSTDGAVDDEEHWSRRNHRRHLARLDTIDASRERSGRPNERVRVPVLGDIAGLRIAHWGFYVPVCVLRVKLLVHTKMIRTQFLRYVNLV